jgi:hypothetical protein
MCRTSPRFLRIRSSTGSVRGFCSSGSVVVMCANTCCAAADVVTGIYGRSNAERRTAIGGTLSWWFQIRVVMRLPAQRGWRGGAGLDDLPQRAPTIIVQERGINGIQRNAPQFLARKPKLIRERSVLLRHCHGEHQRIVRADGNGHAPVVELAYGMFPDGGRDPQFHVAKQVVRSTQTRRLGLEQTPPAWPCTVMLCQACPAVATA